MTSVISAISLFALVGICLAEANYLPPLNGNGNGNGNTLNGNGNGVYRNGNGNGNGGNGNGAFGNGNGNGGYTNGYGVNGNGNGNGVNGNGNGANGNGVYVNGNGANGNGVYTNGNGVNGGYQNGNGVTVYANGVVDPFRALADAIGGGGVPGVDYPILAFVPATGFSCNGQLPGYYADTAPEAGCQVFHICQAGGRIDSFLCPNGTVFNQQYFVCDWWYNFDCSTAEQFYGLNAEIGNINGNGYSNGNGNGNGYTNGNGNGNEMDIRGNGYTNDHHTILPRTSHSDTTHHTTVRSLEADTSVWPVSHEETTSVCHRCRTLVASCERGLNQGGFHQSAGVDIIGRKDIRS
nr:insoluble matrix shell protein 4-like [Penaeus vannamei]